MVKEFIPYDLAVAMKRIGFDEICYALVTESGEIHGLDLSDELELEDDQEIRGYNLEECISAPLFQQAFRWFRERKYLSHIDIIDSWDEWGWKIALEDSMSPIFIAEFGDGYKSYEEAQIECLKQLIEIYESNMSTTAAKS